MASFLIPYINFPGNARQALEFYHEVFGGALTMRTYGEFGMSDPENADKIMHGRLEADKGFALMCADIPPGEEYKPGANISVSLNGDDGSELRGYWEKLSAEGTVSVPLEKQMWGDEFGACTDRFGIPWMVNIGQPET